MSNARKLNDGDLMRRVSEDDEAAIGELYDRFGALVYRLAYQMLPSTSEVEDAVQEVFVRLWRTSDRYDSSRAALSTWVVLITRRYLVDRLRRIRARVKANVTLEEQWAPEGGSGRVLEGIQQDERFVELMKKMERLPELQRTVLTRAYLGGQTLRQIGEELDRPIGTIKSTLSRAVARLREMSVGEEPMS